MPHFIAEYTDNIEPQADLPGLFEKIHRVLGDSGVFPLGGIRSRVFQLGYAGIQLPYPLVRIVITVIAPIHRVQNGIRHAV